jgi:hypothetical protein
MSRHFPSATAADHERTGTSPSIAEIMDSRPKAVFSRTLQTAAWPPATILRGDTAGEIARL